MIQRPLGGQTCGFWTLRPFGACGKDSRAWPVAPRPSPSQLRGGRLVEEGVNVSHPPAASQRPAEPTAPSFQGPPGLPHVSVRPGKGRLGRGSCWNVASTWAWASWAPLPFPAPRAWLGLAGYPGAQSWLTETQKNVWNLPRGEPPASLPSPVASAMSIAALRGEWLVAAGGGWARGPILKALGTRRLFESRECGDFQVSAAPRTHPPSFP